MTAMLPPVVISPIERVYRALGGALGVGLLGVGGYFTWRALLPYFNYEDGDEPGSMPSLEADLTSENILSIGPGLKQGQGWRRGKPEPVQLKEVQRGFYLSASGAADAFIEMSAAAMNEGGIVLKLNTAFRTMREQQRLYDSWRAGKGSRAAVPGWSNHQLGLAADIESASGTNQAFHWLTTNARRFEFKRTVASEPWHWEYVA